MKIIRVIKVLFIFSYIISTVLSSQSRSKAKMNSHFKLLSKNKLASKVKFSEESNLAPRNSNSDLPDMPIYYQSWVKYFHYQKLENDTSKKPNFFFRNGSFKSQDSNKPDHDDQVSSYLILYYLLL